MNSVEARALIREMHDLRRRIKEATGVQSIGPAMKILYETVADDDRRQAARQEQEEGWTTPAPEPQVGTRRSIRTVSGGLPTLGKR